MTARRSKTHRDASQENGAKTGPNVPDPPVGRRFSAGNQAAKGYGRPSTHAEMRELCRGHTQTVINKWALILLKSDSNAAVKAGENLMAYAWGKPNQPISGPDDGPIKFQDERAEINRKLETMLQAAREGEKAAGDKPDGT